MNKNTKSPLLALFVALALIAAACGSGDETATDEAPATNDTVAAATEPEPAEEASPEPTDIADTEAEVIVDVGFASEDAINGGKPTSIAPGGAPLVLEATDLIEGDGNTAAPGDLLVMHYVGVLEDGTEFDASWDRGDTFSFPLGQGRVIRGWDEGIIGMQEGGRRVLSIPPEQAYGAESPSPAIPANSPLFFVVDLVAAITPPDVANAPEPVTELQVEVLEEGDGEIVELGDIIEVHFVALVQETGQEIASTFVQGQPTVTEIGADPSLLLVGLDQAIEGNAVGSWLRVIVPPELGIENPEANGLPPEPTLVVELLINGIR